MSSKDASPRTDGKLLSPNQERIMAILQGRSELDIQRHMEYEKRATAEAQAFQNKENGKIMALATSMKTQPLYAVDAIINRCSLYRAKGQITVRLDDLFFPSTLQGLEDLGSLLEQLMEAKCFKRFERVGNEEFVIFEPDIVALKAWKNEAAITTEELKQKNPAHPPNSIVSKKLMCHPVQNGKTFHYVLM